MRPPEPLCGGRSDRVEAAEELGCLVGVLELQEQLLDPDFSTPNVLFEAWIPDIALSCRRQRLLGNLEICTERVDSVQQSCRDRLTAVLGQVGHELGVLHELVHQSQHRLNLNVVPGRGVELLDGLLDLEGDPWAPDSTRVHLEHDEHDEADDGQSDDDIGL